MNAWLKPYRRALHLEEPVVKITEEQQFKCHIDTIIKKQVPVCCFTFGIPESIIKRLKEANIKLIGTATSVDEAIANEKAVWMLSLLKVVKQVDIVVHFKT